MYIPKFFLEEDETKIIEFMQEFNFATVVTSKNDFPEASHLPFIIEKHNEKIILSSHMAKANFQWKDFVNKYVLVIFQEPHAYISPSLYEELVNVPTWNYIAIHAYGKVKIFESAEKNLKLLEKIIYAFDKEYFEGNWQKIPLEYKLSRAKAVIAFEIEVTDLQAKKKLNQNKDLKDAKNVIAKFENSDDQNERKIARFMKETYQK